MQLRRLAMITVAAALLLAVAAHPAFGATTRAEYVAQAERACKVAERQTAKRLASFKPSDFERFIEEDDPEKLLRFIAKLTGKANKPLGKMVKRLFALEPAPGDEVLVAEWLDGLGDYKRLTDRYVRATWHGKYERAFRRQEQGLNALIGGARFVNGFGFKRCPGGEVVTDSFAAGYALRGLSR